MFVDVFKGIFFFNIRYFFIAKKQQLVLYSCITYREIENNQPGSGAFARFFHPHPGEFANANARGLARERGGGGDGHCWN